MQIQWFPGHMHKARKEFRDTIPKVDLIIEILDARIPFSSENPMIAAIRRNKPCLKILSKSDLADPEITVNWQDYLERERSVKTLAVSTAQPESMRQLIDLCRKMVPHKVNATKIIHAMIMGIPNVGKSTLINTLVGKAIAKTGNEPAITKAQQRITLTDDIVLLDTPGVLWPNIENRNSGYRLAATGAIRDTAIDHDDVAFFAADYLLRNYPAPLVERYLLDPLPQNELALLEMIGRKRGCLRSGGQVDLDKVAKLFLNELRAGTLGRISLETPVMMEQELAELEIIRQKKAAKKELKKLNKKKK